MNSRRLMPTSRLRQGIVAGQTGPPEEAPEVRTHIPLRRWTKGQLDRDLKAAKDSSITAEVCSR
jgi:hypothetical protein